MESKVNAETLNGDMNYFKKCGNPRELKWFLLDLILTSLFIYLLASIPAIFALLHNLIIWFNKLDYDTFQFSLMLFPHIAVTIPLVVVLIPMKISDYIEEKSKYEMIEEIAEIIGEFEFIEVVWTSHFFSYFKIIIKREADNQTLEVTRRDKDNRIAIKEVLNYASVS